VLWPVETHYAFETYSPESAQGWCQLFDCGGQNLNDDQRSGRPLINHLDDKIPAHLERELFSSAYSLVVALDMSPAIVMNRGHNSVGMKISISAGF
jgi:hypothetical protein